MIMGKLFAGLFGFLMGARFGFTGALLGLLIGFYFGDAFDKGLKTAGSGWSLFSLGTQIRECFFNSTFSIMGYIAKLDGRVSEDEIKTAEQIMTRLGLTPELRKKAIDLFNQGKQSHFSWVEPLDQLKRVCGRYGNLLWTFIEIQMETAYAEAALTEQKRQVLIAMAERLGISSRDFARLDAMYRARQRFNQGRYQSYYSSHSSSGPQFQRPEASLEDAYEILGVKPSAADQEVTRAYRKLMSQHHPDKLVSQGLPEEMMKLATEKTQQIKAAYDQIMQARKRKQ